MSMKLSPLYLLCTSTWPFPGFGTDLQQVSALQSTLEIASDANEHVQVKVVL